MERSIRLYIYSTCLETIGTKTLVLGCCQCRLKHVHNGMHSTRKKKSLLHLWMTQHPSGTIAPSSEWLSKQFNRDTRNKITLFVKKNCAELQGSFFCANTLIECAWGMARPCVHSREIIRRNHWKRLSSRAYATQHQGVFTTLNQSEAKHWMFWKKNHLFNIFTPLHLKINKDKLATDY